MKKYLTFLSENFQFLESKFSIYLNRSVFVMNTINQSIKPFLDNKMSIFEEYGAFKVYLLST